VGNCTLILEIRDVFVASALQLSMGTIPCYVFMLLSATPGKVGDGRTIDDRGTVWWSVAAQRRFPHLPEASLWATLLAEHAGPRPAYSLADRDCVALLATEFTWQRALS
jgi:hypothetical protein